MNELSLPCDGAAAARPPLSHRIRTPESAIPPQFLSCSISSMIPACRARKIQSFQMHCCSGGGSGGGSSKHQLEAMISVQHQQQQVPIPPYFRCPISLDLMHDPVTLSTGQTYDRASIEKWVADGNSTCPATMQRLRDFTLIPNHTLRRLIQDWCFANRFRGVQRPPTPKQQIEQLDHHRVQGLLLEARNGLRMEQQVAAIRSIRALAKESDKNRALLQESGAVETLMAALFFQQDSDCLVDRRGVIEESSGALAVLLLRESDAALVVKNPHRLSVISSILASGSLEARTNVGLLIEKLAVLENFRTAIGETEGIMQGVVRLVSDSSHPRAAKAGVKALFSLCLSACSKLAEVAVAAGAPAALVEHLPDVAEKRDAERTLAALELLCKEAAGRAAVAGHALAVPALVRMILKVSDRATECAAGALFAICSGSRIVQREAIRTGVLAQLLLLMQSDCTERGKRKAVELLKLFRTRWPDNLCVAELCRTGVVPF